MPPSPAGASAGPSSAKQTLAQQSEFTKRASQIGLAIHKVSAKLQKLAQLAKRTSMFDDPSLEIDELTGIIKQEIQTLKTAIAELERVSGRTREENKQTMDHSHTVVDNLRARLKDTTLEFKEVLTLRTDNLKAHKSRRQLFSNAPEAGAPPGGGRRQRRRRGLAGTGRQGCAGRAAGGWRAGGAAGAS